MVLGMKSCFPWAALDSLWVVLSEIVYDKVYSKVRCDLRIDSIVVQLFV